MINDSDKTREELIEELVSLRGAEERLRESGAKCRRLSENSPAVVFRFLLSPEGQFSFSYISDAVTRTMGVSAEAVLADSSVLLGLIIPEDQKVFSEAVFRSAQTLTPYRQMLRLMRDGDLVWMDARSTPTALSDGWVAWDGFFFDITERKRDEEELRSNARRFDAWLSSNFIGILQSNDDGDILEANDRLLDMLGYSRQDLVDGKLDWAKLTPPKWSHLDQVAIGEAAELGYWRPFEKEYLHKDGHAVPIMLGGSIFKEDPNEYVAFIVDLTESKKAEKNLLTLQSLESLGFLAGGIAHDFNNLLSGILGNLSLAKMDIASGGNLYGLIEESERACTSAKSLTHQLLTFAKGGEPSLSTTSLAPLLKEVATFATRGSTSKCCFRIEPDLWHVNVDRDQLTQALQNLVINATLAMPDGGAVTVSACNAPGPSSDAAPADQGRSVRITISDEGVGIPKEILPKIFAPYFSTRGSPGLGLATCLSIVTKHGGRIEATSELGAGTAFEIVLPAADRAEAPAERQASAPRCGGGSVLVMEDDSLVSLMLSSMLARLGYTCEVTADGAQALQSYEAALKAGGAPDLVIMDLTIKGGMGGKEAVGRLKELDPDAKVIVSSGYSADPVIAQFADYGFVGTLEKPYTMSELSKVLTQHIGARPE